MYLKYILPKNSIWLPIPLVGFAIGWWLDNKETERLTIFRDKSALYGRELAENEQPSWP